MSLWLQEQMQTAEDSDGDMLISTHEDVIVDCLQALRENWFIDPNLGGCVYNQTSWEKTCQYPAKSFTGRQPILTWYHRRLCFLKRTLPTPYSISGFHIIFCHARKVFSRHNFSTQWKFCEDKVRQETDSSRYREVNGSVLYIDSDVTAVASEGRCL